MAMEGWRWLMMRRDERVLVEIIIMRMNSH
jgi:hypothetical protein